MPLVVGRKPLLRRKTKRIVKAGTTSKKSYGPTKPTKQQQDADDVHFSDDDDANISSGDEQVQQQEKYSLLNEQDRERAEQILQKEAQAKQQYEVNKEQEKLARSAQIKQMDPILETVEHSNKDYAAQQQFNKFTLQKYKRHSKKPLPYEQGAFKFSNTKVNRDENVRNAVWADQARAKAELKLAETEILRKTEVPTGIQLDDDDIVKSTADLDQIQILNAVDKASQKKVFDVELKQHGPYIGKYNVSGRHVLLGGAKGHLATIFWRKFDLVQEQYMKSSVRDLVWMMDDSMYAVAHEQLTCVYNEQGHEIHRMNDFAGVKMLEYLPYHYLLVGAQSHKNKRAILYKDITIGEMVGNVALEEAPLCMAQNPYNAIICVGHANGTVSMVTPRDEAKKPTISLLCHDSPVRKLAVDQSGKFMVTSATDGKLKVWDIRHTYKALKEVHLGADAVSIKFSDKGMLAVAAKNMIYIWKHASQINERPYLKHAVPASAITNLDFCPYEDILGIGHARGFSSILVPGCGQQNIDSRLPNPFSSKAFSKDYNVKTLLEKIPADMITLDPTVIGTSGARDEDFKFKKGVELTEDIKEELANQGIENKTEQENLKKRKLSSRDSMRDALYEENAKKKAKLAKNWWEVPDGDALLRFAGRDKMGAGENEDSDADEEQDKQAEDEDADDEIFAKMDRNAKQFLPKVYGHNTNTTDDSDNENNENNNNDDDAGDDDDTEQQLLGGDSDDEQVVRVPSKYAKQSNNDDEEITSEEEDNDE